MCSLTFHYFYHGIVFIETQRSVSKSDKFLFLYQDEEQVQSCLMKQQKWSHCKSLSGWAMTCPVLVRSRNRFGWCQYYCYINILILLQLQPASRADRRNTLFCSNTQGSSAQTGKQQLHSLDKIYLSNWKKKLIQNYKNDTYTYIIYIIYMYDIYLYILFLIPFQYRDVGHFRC